MNPKRGRKDYPLTGTDKPSIKWNASNVSFLAGWVSGMCVIILAVWMIDLAGGYCG
jgi:hypothetical protein